jgi:ethanolamine utilization protein EutP (predicted NTPase)
MNYLLSNIITLDKIDLPPGTITDYEQILTQLGDRAILRIRFRDNHVLL